MEKIEINEFLKSIFVIFHYIVDHGRSMTKNYFNYIRIHYM